MGTYILLQYQRYRSTIGYIYIISQAVVPPILHVYKTNQFHLPPPPQRFPNLHSSNKLFSVLHSSSEHIQAPTASMECFPPRHSEAGIFFPRPLLNEL